MPDMKQAGPEVYELAEQVIRKYMPLLKELDVSYDLWLCYPKRDKAGNIKSPALKHHGYAAAGKIKINSAESRLKGHKDVTVYLDAEQWQDGSPTWRASLLHHEFWHLVPQKTYDDANRPVLKLRLHDVQLGVFPELIQIYQDQGADTQAVKKAGEQLKAVQGVLNFWG